MNVDRIRVCSQGTLGCFCDAKDGEALACAWCGKKRWRQPDEPNAMTTWCGSRCFEEHRAANPSAEFFVGMKPIQETLPGGPQDGVWENSGFDLSGET